MVAMAMVMMLVTLMVMVVLVVTVFMGGQWVNGGDCDDDSSGHLGAVFPVVLEPWAKDLHRTNARSPVS